MKIEMIKDWSFHRTGDVVDVFDPTAIDWINSGVARRAVDSSKEETVERSVVAEPPRVERTSRRFSPKK